jgi:hypothetical protein
MAALFESYKMEVDNMSIKIKGKMDIKVELAKDLKEVKFDKINRGDQVIIIQHDTIKIDNIYESQEQLINNTTNLILSKKWKECLFDFQGGQIQADMSGINDDSKNNGVIMKNNQIKNKKVLVIKDKNHYNENVALLIKSTHNFSNNNTWEQWCYSCLISKNKEVISIKFNIEDTLDLLKNKINKFKNVINSFKQEVKFFNYTIEKYLTLDNNKERLSKINSIIQKETNKSIDCYYKPFYINENLNIKAYYKGIKEDKINDFIINSNDKIVDKNYVESDKRFNKEYRIIKAIYNFKKSNQNGIDPKTGDYYKDGKKDNENIYYNDNKSIKTSLPGRLSTDYFIKIKDYFVPIENETEKKEIEQRIGMVRKLSDDNKNDFEEECMW